MAQNKFLLCLILVAFIIFCQGFQSIEGRHLKFDKMHSAISVSITNVADVSGSPPSAGRDVDNFRPTAPGHSPGVGHSIHN
uniref:Uncharacterized protein n=1 Tax=Cajanus cajan TaxID=3821 RepID=A0A151TIK6_CAJCA|nr:hypothetical protein KK1_013170 [Cajanus cajan]